MPDTKPHHLLALLLFAAVATGIHAAEGPPAPALTDALAAGKVSLDSRLRWEYADQAGLANSDAFTLRTALGYTSAPWYGFQGMVEAENVAALNDEDSYNAAGTNPGGAGHTVIADPPVTDVNQAWLSYQDAPLTLKAGRQRIVLDNARFIGDVGWRQNMQTFDAAALTFAPTKDITAYYAYVWHVSRVFGNQSPQPDFRSNSHLINVAWRVNPACTLTTYAYLLDFRNSAANSSSTWGASLAGAEPVSSAVKVTYRLEAASQQGAANNPVDYTARYYLGELGATRGKMSLAAGYEVLGSDRGLKGFSTPLATLHAFDGWADVFLATPARGLRDFYVSAGATLPGALPLKVVFHEFRSDDGDLDYGNEWDVLLSRRIAAHVTALVKWARYNGSGPYADISRVWLQCEFSL